MKIYGKNIIIPSGIGWNGAAYKEGYEDGEQAQKEKLTATSITENGTYTAEDGFSEVVVDATGYTKEDLRNAYQSGWTDAMEECQRDWSKEYLTLEALSGGTLNVNQPLDSSTNKGEWVSHESGYTLSLNAGDRVRFRGTALGPEAFSGNTLAFNVMGNACSVIAGDDFEEVDNPGAGGMRRMFMDCSGLTDASRLILPSETSGSCYISMFRNCSSLTDAPELPAMVISIDAYTYMFHNCTNLVTAPVIPATSMTYNSCALMFSGCVNLRNVPDLSVVRVNSNSLKQMFENCVSLEKAPAVPVTEFVSGSTESCGQMFKNCENLTTPPALPATTLASSCYGGMFDGCTSLETAPALPATTLGEWCYSYMFRGCTSLVFVPELPATTLSDGCYSNMFEGCSKLVVPPALPATTLAKDCYSHMFEGCLNIVTAPDLPAPVLVDACYLHMFDACVRLAHIKCLATDISAFVCTAGWFEGHRPNGTFTKAAGMNDWTRGVDGIPPAWTVLDA